MSEPLAGTLVKYSESKLALFESGDLSSKSVVIFIGGLTDGLATVGYVPALSKRLEANGWSLAQITLQSSYYQFGMHTLEDDADDIEDAVEYLKTKRGKEKIILFGHSTGCQDAMWYLTVHLGSRVSVDAAILQAPVSDYDFVNHAASPEIHRWAEEARRITDTSVTKDEWMPREASLSLANALGSGETPYTAYRFASLFHPRGDDDFFSEGIPSEELAFKLSQKPMLLLLCNSDESYPPTLASREAKEKLLERWIRASEGTIDKLSTVIEGANHTVDDPEASERMLDVVIEFLKTVE
ncbi:uncharacterized protein EI90DRAFT_3114985 [Cantharellus anzutake]|uniref:uncharacterized protein n=1 Tax=Cantharellus anzutake TaxID=1750568 RepID=UPI0019030650|nr:uncharacterized protein EI90DRAFT_3114985 [Cantharellus anzutake]KAF8344238.1 hypothetical protein EI90DRAFT_3114985 [Cantharellus anzutake]